MPQQSMYEKEKQPQRIAPLFLQTFRLLVAKPYVDDAVKKVDDYHFDGPGGGGRIFQIRLKSTGSPVFRLDYFPMKTGGENVLHYHVPPTLKEHYVIWSK